MILIFFVNQIEGAWDPTFLDLVPSVTNPLLKSSNPLKAKTQVGAWDPTFLEFVPSVPKPLLKSSNPFMAKTRVVGTGTRQQVVKYKNTSFSASI
ncbi:hypothetical protein M8J75_005821 [Diaphorina citri]|nr:hypothetical protein M8J75_005821 [Diaphorina citri]